MRSSTSKITLLERVTIHGGEIIDRSNHKKERAVLVSFFFMRILFPCQCIFTFDMFEEGCLDICLIRNPFSCSLCPNLIQERYLEAYGHGFSSQMFSGRYFEIFLQFFEILHGFSCARIHKIKDFLFLGIERVGLLCHREKY